MDLELDLYSQPRPRPPRSSARAAQIRIQNRRREFLARTPGYFDSPDHDHADLRVYNILIRRFLTPAEREADTRKKGYGHTLEGALILGEERLAGLAELGQAQNQLPVPEDDDLTRPSSRASTCTLGREPSHADETEAAVDPADLAALERATGSASLPNSKEEGKAKWEAFLRDRFIHGKDDNFAYTPVDQNDEYDALERADQEEAWFDEESPQWEGDDNDDDSSGKGSERILTGETGVQDF